MKLQVNVTLTEMPDPPKPGSASAPGSQVAHVNVLVDSSAKAAAARRQLEALATLVGTYMASGDPTVKAAPAARESTRRNR